MESGEDMKRGVPASNPFARSEQVLRKGREAELPTKEGRACAAFPSI
jgi:hypothetical protein